MDWKTEYILIGLQENFTYAAVISKYRQHFQHTKIKDETIKRQVREAVKRGLLTRCYVDVGGVRTAFFSIPKSIYSSIQISSGTHQNQHAALVGGQPTQP